MRKILILTLALITTTTILSQNPSTISYQAVLRGNSGEPIANKTVGIRITILRGSSTGLSIYTEKTSTTSNNFGLVHLEIGSMNTTAFSAIDWSVGSHFLQVEVDPTGGENYYMLGTSQLLAVPYALYAKSAGSTVEKDPLFTAHSAFEITYEDIESWRTLYTWGNHADAGYLKSFTETDPAFGVSAAKNITSANISDWTSAYSWGDHSTAGYLKSYTEADPIFNAHPTSVITSTDITNWNTAFGWGSHSGLYKPVSYIPTWSEISGKPTFSPVAFSGDYNDLANKPTGISADWNFLTNNPFDISLPANGQLLRYNSASGYWENYSPDYLSSFTETDPVFGISAAKNITSANISDWTSAYSWGDHAGLYKTISYVPTWNEITGKPNFASIATSGNYADLINSPFSITSPVNNQLLKFNSSSGKWENWTPNYLINFTEVDPSFTASFNLSGANANDLLMFDGSMWVKYTPNFALSSHTHSSATTSSNGFMSSTDKSKLDGIAASAEVNVNADWNATSGDAQILNKPNQSVQTLSGTTPAWNVNSGMNAIITLTGNTTITFSNLVAGTYGNLTVVNSATAYTISFSGYTNKISQAVYTATNQVATSGSGKIDVFSWYYDGIRLIWNGTLDYK